MTLRTVAPVDRLSWFIAARWVRTAMEAGAEYLVVTAKHQDGFAMFRSRVDVYNVVDATPFARDPIEEPADARDYHHPGANWNDHGNTWDFPPQTEEDFRRYFAERAIVHVTELLTQYGDICLMWFDVPYRIPRDLSATLRSHVLGLQPACLINSRIGNDQGDYLNLGDNELPGTPPAGSWETCMTMNNTWGYSRFDENWKSVDGGQQGSYYLWPNARRRATEAGGMVPAASGPTLSSRFPPMEFVWLMMRDSSLERCVH